MTIHVRRIGHGAIVLGLCVVAISAAQTAEPISGDSVRTAIGRGVEFLLKDQNPDGAWGSHREALIGLDDAFMNEPSQRAFTIGTTGLGCLALATVERTPQRDKAYDRGIEYIIAHAVNAKRISDWDVDNTWAFVYGLAAAVDAYSGPRYANDAERREALAKTIRGLLDRFKQYQTPLGGWGYYDSGDTVTFPPNWATSFMTSAAILAMLDAKAAGFEPDQAMLERAVKAIRRCRLPTGAYTYSLDIVSTPGHSEGINNIKGSLGRIQICNLTLYRAAKAGFQTPGREIDVEQLCEGLDHFFREHRFLDIARGRPIPHEAYYANAAYFYFFGHYYAAQVIAELPESQRTKYWEKFQREIVKTQESDGSMWDYPMNSYGKPYGTAFAVLSLQESLRARPAPASGPAATSRPGGAGESSRTN